MKPRDRSARAIRVVGRLPWLALRAGRAGQGRALGVIAVWATWERLMLRLHPVHHVRPGSLVLYRVRRHHGPAVVLDDGTRVEHGAAIVELHLDNRRLVALRAEPGYGTWRAVEVLRQDLRAIGRRVGAGELGEVAALHGVSLLGSAGPAFGFEKREVRHSWGNSLVRYFMAGVDAIYHPEGLRRLEGRARERWPVEVWMSAGQAAGLDAGVATR